MRAESENLIERSVELAVELCDVSEKGQAVSEDSGCSVFFGIVRDCAYAIMLRAETEKKRKVNGCLKGGFKEGVKR